MKKRSLFLFTLILTLAFCSPLMAYSTDSDLFERMDEQLVVQLTDDDNTGAIDQTVLADKRSTCHELVNSYLRGRYEVPMDPAPKLLADIEADLLVEKLYSRRPGTGVPEEVQTDYKEALARLKDISLGRIELEDQPDISAAKIKTNKTAADRKFTNERFRRF